jgi:epoxyqueuosine reductase
VIDRRRLTGEVKERLVSLGFTAVGIAEAAAAGDEGARLQEWLDRGYAASMQWMGKRKAERTDPAQLMPGVQSVIVVSMNYFAPEPPAPEGPKISRYARGLDYHDVLGERLKEFVQWLHDTAPGATSRWYVDTGPVMEKAWAQRAGIGWIGKHTTLISPEHGSWVFLGVVLTTASLIADAAAVDRCGTCTRCIDACPTAAIVEPYVLDAGKCIAYLTIEHRGPFPPGLGQSLDGWIFGCDVCQDVCPWNEKLPRPTQEPAFATRPEMIAPVAAELLALSDDAFNEQFKGTPVVRARPEGMRRNCIAYQNRDEAVDPGTQDSASH